MRWNHFLAVSVVVLLAAPAVLFAGDACTADSDCENGYSCMRIPCAVPACPPGEDCPDVECPDEGECVPGGDDHYDNGPGGIYGGECDTAADCPTGMSCEEMNVPCPDIAGCAPCACDCGPDEPDCQCDCPECPEIPPCDSEIYGVCVFEFADCESDADCDVGFECQAWEACSGGGSTGCACPPQVCVCETCPDGEECPPCECPEPEPCECDEEPVYEESCEVVNQVCEPQEIPCDSAADCPADWECIELNFGSQGSDCMTTSCACPGCDSENSEDCPPCDCPEPEPCEDDDEPIVESYCMPDGWGAIVQDYVDREIGSGGVNTNAGGDKDNPEAGGEGGMFDELFGGGDGNSAPTAAPQDNSANGSSSGGTGSDDEGGMCTMGTAQASPGLLGLGLLLAAAFLLMRRRVPVIERRN